MEGIASKTLLLEEALTAYSELTTVIDSAATEHLGVSLKKMGTSKNDFNDTGDYQKLHKVCSILLNCILAAPNTKWPTPPKVYYKLNKLVGTPYETPLLGTSLPTEDEFGDQAVLVH